MKIELFRFSQEKESTIGMIKINNKLISYTLENSRYLIPKETYEIGYRKVGGFHNRYSEKFEKIHKGMLEIKNVKDRKWILIHCGNEAKDSKGCILVGSKVNINNKKGYVENSVVNYKKLYPLIRDKLDQGEKVEIIIGNI